LKKLKSEQIYDDYDDFSEFKGYAIVGNTATVISGENIYTIPLENITTKNFTGTNQRELEFTKFKRSYNMLKHTTGVFALEGTVYTIGSYGIGKIEG
jgi:hypothetical protein